LKTATFNDRIAEFGEESFRECFALQEVTIGKSVSAIGMSAFDGCVSIAKVNYLSEVCSGENANSSFDVRPTSYEGTELTPVGFDLIIGNGVKEIPDFCFAGSAVKTITFEAGSVCKKIGEGAFYNSELVMNCNLPNTLTEIGENAFYGSDITSVVIPDGVTVIPEFAFSSCHNLTSVTIGSGVTGISRFAFAGSEKIETITFKVAFVWYRTYSKEDWQNKTGGEVYDMSDPAANVEIINESFAAQCYWYRNDSYIT